MRRLFTLIAAVSAFAGPALADVLPIKGNYCLTGTNDARVVLNAYGVGSTITGDGCRFTAVLASFPNAWLVSQDCNNSPDDPEAFIKVKGTHAFVAVYAPGANAPGKPDMFRRC